MRFLACVPLDGGVTSAWVGSISDTILSNFMIVLRSDVSYGVNQ